MDNELDRHKVERQESQQLLKHAILSVDDRSMSSGVLTPTPEGRETLLAERRTRDRKVASSSPGRSSRIIFFSL